MATQKENITNHKQIALILWVVLIWTIFFRWKLRIGNWSLKNETFKIKKDITENQEKLVAFSEERWFDKLQYAKSLENSISSMPRSDHIETIMNYLWDLVRVDKSDTFNVSFSDFELSLEKISLHWYVSSLRLLYKGSNYQSWSKALIEKFEELEFLDHLSIKEYDKSSDNLWYEFVLNANVTNKNGK